MAAIFFHMPQTERPGSTLEARAAHEDPLPSAWLARLSAHAEFVSRFDRRTTAAADQCPTVSASERIGNCNRTLRTVEDLGRLGNRFHLKVNVA